MQDPTSLSDPMASTFVDRIKNKVFSMNTRAFIRTLALREKTKYSLRKSISSKQRIISERTKSVMSF